MFFTLGIFHTSLVILSRVPVTCLMQSIKLLKKIHEQFPSEAKIYSCLITKCTDGSSICPQHSDNEPFINHSSYIFTLSMGAERTMKFDGITQHTCKVDDSMLLKDNDLLVFPVCPRTSIITQYSVY